MTDKTLHLGVVDSDKPSSVRMFNSLGCDIGTWGFDEWIAAVATQDIIIQIGDKFVFEGD